MTNEQLAIYLKQINERLKDGLSNLKNSLAEDLPNEKWSESESVFGNKYKNYMPLLELENVQSDLEENIEVLTS